jgi:predicted transporter
MKLALLTLAAVAGMGWLAGMVWLVAAFIRWCLRPAERSWDHTMQVISWSVFAWWAVLFIILGER